MEIEPEPLMSELGHNLQVPKAVWLEFGMSKE